jgi:hypothetical protein
MNTYHRLAMQAVIPLLAKRHDYYKRKFAFLNGIKSRDSPPGFGDYNGWTNDYYTWAKVIADAVASPDAQMWLEESAGGTQVRDPWFWRAVSLAIVAIQFW